MHCASSITGDLAQVPFTVKNVCGDMCAVFIAGVRPIEINRIRSDARIVKTA